MMKKKTHIKQYRKFLIASKLNFIILLSSILIIGSWLLYSIQGTNRDTAIVNSNNTYPEPEPIFIKRNFLPSDKFMNTYDYPDELLNLSDKNLIGFNCLERYDYQPNGYYSDEDYFKFKKDELYDSDGAFIAIKAIEEKIKTSKNGTITSISPCTTDENKDILAYSVVPNIVTSGGGIGSDVFYGYISSGNILNKSIVPREEEAYFRCNEVLAITKDGYLYVSCGSGDGGYATKSIYKINLLRGGNATLLHKCKSAFDQPTTCGKIQ